MSPGPSRARLVARNHDENVKPVLVPGSAPCHRRALMNETGTSHTPDPGPRAPGPDVRGPLFGSIDAPSTAPGGGIRIDLTHIDDWNEPEGEGERLKRSSQHEE